jgi:hypothetical protein
MEQDYYGAPGSNDPRTLGERLRDLYDPEDFVKVMNIDTKPVTYQFTGPNDVEVTQPRVGEKETIMHRPPRRVTLQPGETKLCPAYEADLMINVLVKQLAVSRTTQMVQNGTFVDKNQPTDWSDPVLQSNLLNQIFLGKHDVLSEYNAPSVDKDLDIDERPKVGRPRKES